MAESEPVPQKQFNTLDDFIKGQNNFYYHFRKGNQFGERRRERSYFKRFQSMYPDLEAKTTELVVKAVTAKHQRRLPYELLWGAYKLMSELVTVEDVGSYSAPDEYLIA